MDTSYVAHSNWRESLCSFDLAVSLSFSTIAEVIDFSKQNPAQISGAYVTLSTIACSNYKGPSLLSSPGCPTMAGTKYHVLTSSANISLCKLTVYVKTTPAGFSLVIKELQCARE